MKTVKFGSVMKQSLLLASIVLFAAVGAGCTQESLDTRNSSADNNGDKITLCVSAVTKNPEDHGHRFIQQFRAGERLAPGDGDSADTVLFF